MPPWLGCRERWEKFVGDLIGHLDYLLDLRTKWYTYEGEVKGLLEWIMSEAEDFSKDVTTYGEKGIKDHLDSCSVRSACLVERKEGIINWLGGGGGGGRNSYMRESVLVNDSVKGKTVYT